MLPVTLYLANQNRRGRPKPPLDEELRWAMGLEPAVQERTPQPRQPSAAELLVDAPEPTTDTGVGSWRRFFRAKVRRAA